MKELDAYNAARLAISAYFGVDEVKLDVWPEYLDFRRMYWRIAGGHTVYYHVKQENLNENGFRYFDPCYGNEWIYRGEEFTLLIVDQDFDGIATFKIFDNAKEVKP